MKKMSEQKKDSFISLKTLKSWLRIEQQEIAENYCNLNLKGEVKNVKFWKNKHAMKFGVFFDLVEQEESFRCVFWDIVSEEKMLDFQNKFENKSCILCANISVNRMYFNFELKVETISLQQDASKTQKINQMCQDLGFFENKKRIDWHNIKKIGILSKKNTQGLCDFQKQLQLPYSNCLKEINLEGPKTVPDIMREIQVLNDTKEVDVILIIRGGGNTTEISNSFDNIDLFRVMKKSSIPIITAIGHANDTDDCLIITKISDCDFETPTTLAKFINHQFFNVLDTCLQEKNQLCHDQFIEIMNKEQYKILTFLQRNVELWCNTMNDYYVIDLDKIPSHKEIVFIKNGKYYKQNFDLSCPISIQAKELKKKNEIMKLLETQNVEKLSQFFLLENERSKKDLEKDTSTRFDLLEEIQKKCNVFVENQKKMKNFSNRTKIPVDWKKMHKNPRTSQECSEMKQMTNFIKEEYMNQKLNKNEWKLLQKFTNSF